MPRMKKKAGDEEAEDVRPAGKLGHACPECGDGKDPAAPAPRGTTLHWSKKAPSELECPNCGNTFPVE